MAGRKQQTKDRSSVEHRLKKLTAKQEDGDRKPKSLKCAVAKLTRKPRRSAENQSMKNERDRRKLLAAVKSKSGEKH
jgi:hypothetical protein